MEKPAKPGHKLVLRANFEQKLDKNGPPNNKQCSTEGSLFRGFIFTNESKFDSGTNSGQRKKQELENAKRLGEIEDRRLLDKLEENKLEFEIAKKELN